MSFYGKGTAYRHTTVLNDVLLRRSIFLTLRAANMGRKSMMTSSRLIFARTDS